MEQLMQLKQGGSLNEYQEEFDALICEVKSSEQQKLSCYMAWLKPEMAVGVKLFGSRTLLEATKLAKFQFHQILREFWENLICSSIKD